MTREDPISDLSDIGQAADRRLHLEVGISTRTLALLCGPQEPMALRCDSQVAFFYSLPW